MTAFAAARQAGDLLYLSGQIAPESERGPDSTVITQTQAAYRQVQNLLASHGLSLSDIQYVTGYLHNPSDFADYDRAWQQVFQIDPPARTTVSATILVDNALVELAVIAAVSPRAAE